MYLNITKLNEIKAQLNETYENLKNNLPAIYREISSINSNLVSVSLADVNSKLLEKVGYSTYVVHSHLKSLIDFIDRQIKEYEKSNEEAKEKLNTLVNHISEIFDVNGNITKYMASPSIEDNIYTVTSDGNTYATSEVKDSPATLATGPETRGTINGAVDTSVYSSKPELGFVVTTGNPTYNLSEADKEYLYAIVEAESDHSYDDALGVSSVVLNRCSNSDFVYSNGPTVVNQLEAPGQFYGPRSNGGRYTQFLGGNVSPTVKKAVDDALNGVRNHNYLYYRSNASTSYSNNMITSTGNRYGYK